MLSLRWVAFLLFCSLTHQVWASGLRCEDLLTGRGGSPAEAALVRADYLKTQIHELLSSAKDSIDIENSTVADKEVIDLLQGKARQKVKVRVLIDGRHLGKSEKLRQEALLTQQKLEESGAEVRFSDLSVLSKWRRFPQSYLHRKIVIIDGVRYYIGSGNLGEHRLNMEVALFQETGRSVNDVRSVFELDWAAASAHGREVLRNLPQVVNATSEPVSLVGPGTARPDIRAEILHMIRSAQKRILISTFEANDKSVMDAIIEQRQLFPQLDVRIVLCQSRASVWFGAKHFALPKNGRFHVSMHDAGIDVRFYAVPDSYNHSRLVIADNKIYLGSGDLTRRSFEGNVELGALISTEADGQNLARGFEDIWSISSADVHPSLKDRMIERGFYFLETLTIAVYRILGPNPSPK